MLKIRHRERVQASPKRGLRQGWDEYQVVKGRKIIARFDTLEQARKAYPNAKPTAGEWVGR